jgi:WhiB family transcriptional regulator, redox-sensing transcriptional regulator
MTVNKLKANHETDWNLLNQDFEWTDAAACKGMPTSMFFPLKGGPNKTVRAAKAICVDCVVKTNCLNFALDNAMQYGIWGGATTKERRHLRAARKYNAANPITK